LNLNDATTKQNKPFQSLYKDKTRSNSASFYKYLARIVLIGSVGRFTR